MTKEPKFTSESERTRYLAREIDPGKVDDPNKFKHVRQSIAKDIAKKLDQVATGEAIEEHTKKAADKPSELSGPMSVAELMAEAVWLPGPQPRRRGDKRTAYVRFGKSSEGEVGTWQWPRRLTDEECGLVEDHLNRTLLEG